MTSGLIFDIKRYAINDGPGIRTAVFMKGCPLGCLWCHNPEGQTSQPQLMFRANRCIASKACIVACPRGAIHWDNASITDWEACDGCGKCAEVCYSGAREMVGRVFTLNELMAEIDRDIPFYDQSGGGVTFTGGEPMHQVEFLHAALVACRENGIHITLDTSGYAAWESFELVQPMVDLFLYDLKLMDDQKHMHFTGVSNRLILDNLHRLSDSGVKLIVRIPFIPSVNDDDKNIEQTAIFLSSLTHLDGVELMPYHEIGVAKYQSLGMKYPLEGTKHPESEDIRLAELILLDSGLPVRQRIPGD